MHFIEMIELLHYLPLDLNLENEAEN